MSSTPLLSRQERESYQEYDYQRRLRLSRIITWVNFTAIAAASPLITLYLLFHLHPLDSYLVVVDITGWLVTGCFTLGVIAVRRGNVNLATVAVCGGALLGIGIILVYATATTGINVISLVSLFAVAVVIFISGILGTRLVLIAVTTLAILGGGVLLIFNASSALLEQSAFLVVLLFTLIFATLGVIMVVFQQGYQRTLRELGEARIAYEQARQLDDLKNQFIVNVNHELRNPVMAMMGHLDILDMSLESAPRERLQKLTQGAIRASENLRALLASILDTTRMEQGMGDFTPEQVPLARTIQSAAELISPLEGTLQGRELRVLVPEWLNVWGEPIRLQQIMTNLISNALKYSPPGTPIEVRARVVIGHEKEGRRRKPAAPEKHQEWVEITVRDWGLGVPREQIPFLFQRFVRLPRDLASTVIGNGLGLYLCRVCAEAMEGSIWVESAGIEGEGSTFHVRLPYRPEGVNSLPVSR
jgi:signal transduction histidine kinase